MPSFFFFFFFSFGLIVCGCLQKWKHPNIDSLTRQLYIYIYIYTHLCMLRDVTKGPLGFWKPFTMLMSTHPCATLLRFNSSESLQQRAWPIRIKQTLTLTNNIPLVYTCVPKAPTWEPLSPQVYIQYPCGPLGLLVLCQENYNSYFRPLTGGGRTQVTREVLSWFT